MKLHELTYTPGARHAKKRVGRGTGSGTGKTAGRGTKGQNSRSGGGVRPGFEGGQTPLFQRLPKRGFTNRNRKEYTTINLDVLNKFENGTEITPEFLKDNGVVKQVKTGIKILGNGQLDKKLTISAHKFSNTAKEAIEAAGGSVIEL
ncbi:50S ribosomal protein L15 [Mycoplasma sp. P36-A1]|uniref:50S ribosomal protein L15 n=1 Tax=Mycoplasma sp. P36-A1 TaxID=3252900 RepID=UPI003C2F57FB